MLALIGLTRGMIGFGAGLLLSEKLARRGRQQLGFALLGAGALSTIPLMMRVLHRGTDERTA